MGGTFMKKIIALVISFIMLLSLSACGKKQESSQQPAESAKPIILKVGTTAAPDGHYVAGLEEFKKRVEEYSGKKVEVQIFHSSQLGNERDLVEGVSLGTIEMALVSTGPLPNFSQEFLVLDLPFIISDKQKGYEFMDGEYGQQILGSLEPKGIKAFGFWENGFRHLTNSKKEVKKPSDVAGLKIRTMENTVHMESFKLLGANPTPMAWSEVFTALQQKTIDGQENPLMIIETAKVYEAQKYISLTGHFYSPCVLMMNKTLFEGFPQDVKDAILKAEKETRTWQRNYTAEKEATVVDKLKERGIVVTEVDKAEWQKAVEPVYAQFADKIKPEYIKALTGK
jgi:TRAP-type transport system periplasmic protein